MRSRPILIVDDEPAIRLLVSELLMDAGYAVALARHGLEALDALEHLPISLVILDLHMPVMNGKIFARQMRARGFAPPIVLMTSDIAAKGAAQALGAAAILKKPFDVRVLTDTVQRVLAGGTSA